MQAMKIFFDGIELAFRQQNFQRMDLVHYMNSMESNHIITSQSALTLNQLA